MSTMGALLRSWRPVGSLGQRGGGKDRRHPLSASLSIGKGLYSLTMKTTLYLLVEGEVVERGYAVPEGHTSETRPKKLQVEYDL